ncbi:MAG: glycosyltransferase [Ginsengibacter sp.]
MRIALSIHLFTKGYPGDEHDSLFDFFLNLPLSNPEHTFILISDTHYPPSLVFPNNVIPVFIGPEAKNPLTWRIWYNLKIPLTLKRYKADIFITAKFCSLRTGVPQLLVDPDLHFIHQPSILNKRHLHFYKKYTLRFLNKCEAIMVNSMFSKKELIHHYHIEESKISVFFPDVAKDSMPMNYEEREKIKEKYADGNEYFIYNGSITPRQNLKSLLKAFSAFKKRQKSSMQLLITGKPGAEYEEWLTTLKHYRFQAEVKVLDNLSKNETGKIVAGAYAMVYTPFYQTTYNTPMQALIGEVPLIVSEIGALPEACGDAALYSDPGDFRTIAEKMMLLFKDERLRKDLIQRGQAQLKNIEAKRESIPSFHGFDFFKS